MNNDDDFTFVTFRKDGKYIIGHSFSADEPTPEKFAKWNSDSINSDDPADTSSETITDETQSFSSVIDSFLSIMTTYRNMISTTIDLSPAVSGIMANRSLVEYVKSNGELVEKFETPEFSVYRVHIEKYGTLSRRLDQAMAAVKGTEHLPELAIIGLLSVYDAYLGRLLKCIFANRPEMVFSGERQISYADLTSFSSLEDAKSYLIDKDVESVLRDSHHEHFNWMERKFSVQLRKDLAVWPDFIEICERRNLLTHTGGVVSKQYIKNCTEHNVKVSVKIGEQLTTDAEYFRRAVKIISEIGIKLGHVLWRKLIPSERGEADHHLNETGYNLISVKQYQLAEKILDLGANSFKKHSSDSIRRYMIVNYANAIRLQDQQDRASKVLDNEDWSATSDIYQICVAAVKNDIETLCSLINKAGPNGEITIQSYRDWPVFLRVCDDEKFRETILSVFGEPINSPPSKHDIVENTVSGPSPTDTIQ